MTTRKEQVKRLVDNYYSAGDRREWDATTQAEKALKDFGAVMQGNQWVITKAEPDRVWIVTWSIYDDIAKETTIEDKSAFRTYERAFAHADQQVKDIPHDVIERGGAWEKPLQGLTVRVVGLIGAEEWHYLIEELEIED